MMDKIIIRDAKIMGRHGVSPEEKLEDQPFLIDLEMEADLKKPCRTDNLEDTVNYAAVNKLVIKIVRNNSYNLVEKLAEEICLALFQNFDQINRIKITVKKPEAPMTGDFQWVGVEIERSRELA
jgi:dihydroneopterin aldolase